MRVRRWQDNLPPGEYPSKEKLKSGLAQSARNKKDIEGAYRKKQEAAYAQHRATPQSQFSPYRDEESSPLAGVAPHHLPDVEPSESGSRATVSMLSAGIGGFLPEIRLRGKGEQDSQDELDDNYLGFKRLPAVSQARKDGIEEEFQPEIEAILEQEQARQEVRNNPKYKNMVDADKASASRRKAR